MVHVLVKITLWITAFICSLLILSVQLAQPSYYMLIGVLIPSIVIYPLHLFDPKTTPSLNNYAITPFSFTSYMGPYAAELLAPLTYILLFLNVLWALRWLLGIENIATGLYGLTKNQTDFLYACAKKHPYVEGAQTCNVIASFLGNTWPVYLHIVGAVSCLVIGPFQLNGWCRSLKAHRLHRMLGYYYVFFTFLGTIGALGLMIQTTSGIAAGLGFLCLVIIWNVSLAKGIMCELTKTERHSISM